MFTLAAATGWSEHFLLWELPLARAFHYNHARLRAEGVWTVGVRAPAGTEIAELDRIMDAWKEPDDE